MCILGEYLILEMLLAGLFYRSVAAGFIGILGLPFFFHYKRRHKIRKRKRMLSVQFKDCLMSVAGAMRAGYSMENAFRESERDLISQYGADADMVVEIQSMANRLDCNASIESLLEDLAIRSRIEDVANFSSIIGFAKRSGGNYIGILTNSVGQIADKIEIQATIDTLLAARHLEQRIMNVVPLFILAFINLTSGEFLASLYHNAVGICMMTGCLAVYIATYLWSERIVAIEV